MKEINEQLLEIQKRFFLIKTKIEQKKKQLQEKQKQKQLLIKNITTRVEAIDYIERVAAIQRQQVKQKVQKLITECLRQVYDDSYSVQFNYGVKGSRTSVDIQLIRKCPDGLVVRRGLQGIGGGVADSISLPLKLIVLLNDKDCDKILIVDQPGKHLDLDRVPKFASFLKKISDELNVQIIMSSHHQGMDIYADSVNQVSIKGSISSIDKVK